MSYDQGHRSAKKLRNSNIGALAIGSISYEINENRPHISVKCLQW